MAIRCGNLLGESKSPATGADVSQKRKAQKRIAKKEVKKWRKSLGNWCI